MAANIFFKWGKATFLKRSEISGKSILLGFCRGWLCHFLRGRNLRSASHFFLLCKILIFLDSQRLAFFFQGGKKEISNHSFHVEETWKKLGGNSHQKWREFIVWGRFNAAASLRKYMCGTATKALLLIFFWNYFLFFLFRIPESLALFDVSSSSNRAPKKSLLCF